MLINSELPVCMLDACNVEVNDYDFILYHLFRSNDVYKDYYKGLLMDRGDTLNPNFPRISILDNSAYEFYVKGQELNMDEFVKTITELGPSHYILPDVLMDMDKTIQLSKQFLEKYTDEINWVHPTVSPEPIGVVQGNSIWEFYKCLQTYKELGIKNIAIPFHNRFYADSHEGQHMTESRRQLTDIILDVYDTGITEDHKYALGRATVIDELRFELETFEFVHLLGSHCPYEAAVHNWVNTMDTGYPVKLALTGTMLGYESHKPDIIIDQFIGRDLPKSMCELICTNVNIFKQISQGKIDKIKL